jgi:peroxiredoxin family protein
MSSVLICRDAVEDSVLGNLALARAFSRSGEEASVVFTGEALHALDKGTFAWSANFRTRDAQASVIGAAEAMDLPIAHPDLDSRWSDVRTFVKSMQDESGVRLIACPLWCEILKINAGLDYLERVNESELVDLLRNADTVIGGY